MNAGQLKTSPFSALLCLFLVIILGAGEVAPAWGLPEQAGDLNEDGRLTIKDVAFLVNHLRGTAPLPSEVALFADVDRDGALTKSDSTRLAKAAVDLVTVPTIDLKAQDSDYDGRNDAQEIEEGTDPLDPDSVKFVRLGYWGVDEDLTRTVDWIAPGQEARAQVRVWNVNGGETFETVVASGRNDIAAGFSDTLMLKAGAPESPAFLRNLEGFFVYPASMIPENSVLSLTLFGVALIVLFRR